MDKLSTTWLGEFKSVIFLALGIIAVFQIPYMMPFITFLFLVLFGMIAFFRFGEVYIMKRTQNKAVDLFAGTLNLGFVIWTISELVKFPNEDYRDFAENIFVIIGVWLALLIIWGTVQGLNYLIKKNILGNLILIEAILSTLLLFFFYRVTSAIKADNLDERILMNFGIFCISLAVISYLHTRVVKYIVRKNDTDE
jgi:multisubunit Na+/H+ antiporter MnhG subunit